MFATPQLIQTEAAGAAQVEHHCRAPAAYSTRICSNALKESEYCL